MQATKEGIEMLNSLLRGEISAIETYQQALEKIGSDPDAAELRRIHHEHRDAANMIRKQVHELGGKPDQDSGAWGAWAKTVEGTAKMLGTTAALKALKEGEEHGQKSYEDALQEEGLPSECKSAIRSTLLMQTQEHIAALDRLMNKHASAPGKGT